MSSALLHAPTAVSCWAGGVEVNGRSAGVVIYAFVIYQRRLTMISARSSESFELLWGPLCICAALFVAILTNFVLRLNQAREAHGDESLLQTVSLMRAWSVAGGSDGLRV